MPISWDESNPTDSYLIPSYPGNERTFRAAVKAAFGIEHDTTEGMHKFQSGDSTARDALTDMVDGSIFFRDDIESNHFSAELYDGSAWREVIPPTNYPKSDAQSAYTVCQFATAEALTISGGAIDIDFATNPYKTLSLTENITVNAPSNLLASKSSVCTLDITMAGSGSYTLTWNSAYRNPAGSISISPSVGDRTLLSFRALSTTKVLVLAVSDWDVAIT